VTAEAAAAVAGLASGGLVPEVGLVLGSGLGAVAEAIEDANAIPYRDLPGFPVPTVEGHSGRLILGRLAGVPIACLQGRAHLYEGLGADAVTLPIRTLQRLGARRLLLTNAAGSLVPEIGAGRLMLITDHIDFSGRNPLIGPNDAAFGPRFVDLTEAYDPELRSRLLEAAAGEGITLHQGVYVCCVGPSFETPAEIRAFRTIGADAVGMSTVPECIVARHCGMVVAAVSVITNLAAGLGSGPLSHDQTLAGVGKAADNFGRLLHRFLADLGAGT
jgi:xanthosine phosphorylase